MSKKYEIIKESGVKMFPNSEIVLYRIRLLKDICYGKKGDIGGWVESEYNLSQEGNCWIANNAGAYAGGRVEGDALLKDAAAVYNSAVVKGCAEIGNTAHIWENAIVKDYARIMGNASVAGDSVKIYNHVIIKDNANITDCSKVYGHAIIGGHTDVIRSTVSGSPRLYDDTVVFESSVKGYCEAYKKTEIRNSVINGNLRLINSSIEHCEMNEDSTYINVKLFDYEGEKDINLPSKKNKYINTDNFSKEPKTGKYTVPWIYRRID